MINLIKCLYPICRSITGDGVRETLRILSDFIPIKINEVPSGTRVYDWNVPFEWNIKDAWIKNQDGQKILNFKDHNLHVLNYSTPVDKKVNLQELKEHLFTIPEQPDLIPYRTSYYKECWGFCMSHRQFEKLSEQEYHVFIDSSHEPGFLTWGELFFEGGTRDEIVISCHICHPSLANDNLSGIAVATFLADSLLKNRKRYSYRFLFIPGTIGSITWLALNEDQLSTIKYGIVLACVGDSGPITWKKTKQENSEIDRAVARVFSESGQKYELIPFSPYGYDERQFSSPGINLPFGCLMRSPWGTFPEYHTSADNPDFISADCLVDSLKKVTSVLDILEKNRTYLNLNPKCEPRLGKRGLYSQTGGDSSSVADHMAILWLLNMSDGKHSLLDIAERSNIQFRKLHHAAIVLKKIGLLEEKV